MTGSKQKTATQPVLLSVREVSKVYRMGHVDVPALRAATLDIYDGEFLIIAGPSGSGKSTLLNIIGGMDHPTSGTVTFDGRDLTGASDRQLTQFRRGQIGFVFQFFNLVPSLTALENIQVAVDIADDPLPPALALERVGLSERGDHFPAQLSGGEQQRVAVARALAKNPRLILCDEPTGALDSETARQVLQCLYDLNRRFAKTIVLITHNAAIAAIGHRVATIRDGAITKIETNATPLAPAEIRW